MGDKLKSQQEGKSLRESWNSEKKFELFHSQSKVTLFFEKGGICL